MQQEPALLAKSLTLAATCADKLKHLARQKLFFLAGMSSPGVALVLLVATQNLHYAPKRKLNTPTQLVVF